MKKLALILLSCSIASSAMAQDSPRRIQRTGEGAVAASRSATAFSMMSWGVGLAVGIATLCALLDSSSTSHSHSH